jgi:hypothetical protein
MPKKQNLFVARMAQLVERNTYNTTVNGLKLGGAGHNALVSSFIDFFNFHNVTIVLILCRHGYQLIVKIQSVISSL